MEDDFNPEDEFGDVLISHPFIQQSPTNSSRNYERSKQIKMEMQKQIQVISLRCSNRNSNQVLWLACGANKSYRNQYLQILYTPCKMASYGLLIDIANNAI